MAAVVRDGVKAGALGVSTSRTLVHRTRDKAYVPGTFAGVDEMLGIGRALGEAGHGVFEIISDITGPDADLEWMARLTQETGRPISLAALIRQRSGMWMREILAFSIRQCCWHMVAPVCRASRITDGCRVPSILQHASQLQAVASWTQFGGAKSADARPCRACRNIER